MKRTDRRCEGRNLTGSMGSAGSAAHAAGPGLRIHAPEGAGPRPLLPPGGRPTLVHTLTPVAAAGIKTAVVNTHHLSDQIAAFCARRAAPRILLSHEAELLETGGGVAKALPLLGRAAAGSMRDALSLLDQAMAHGAGRVSASQEREMLGAVDDNYLLRLIEALGAGDAGAGRTRAPETAATTKFAPLRRYSPATEPGSPIRRRTQTSCSSKTWLRISNTSAQMLKKTRIWICSCFVTASFDRSRKPVTMTASSGRRRPIRDRDRQSAV